MMNMILEGQLIVRKNNIKGITLIEVIILIAILAILLMIAVPTLAHIADSTAKRAIQTTGHNIQIILQAEKTENNCIIFLDGANGKSPAYGTISYENILKNNGINIIAADLTDIKWGDNGQTLAAFTYKEGKFIIKYDIGEGGFLPVES